MDTTNNTILITGGGSGIGRALAEAFHRLGNRVIVSGRRREALEEVTAANPGMKALALDIDDAAAVQSFAAKLTAEFPALNAVVHNAGVMRFETVSEQAGGVGDAEAMVTTNLLGPIRLNAALLPHLLKQPRATVLTVSSGLAFVPMAAAPTYSATKAAVHSYTVSLRHQLRDTSVQVIEIAPPYVQTHLGGERQATDPTAMPLAEFVAEVMEILQTKPDAAEVVVKRCEPLRYAAETGNFDKAFGMVNSMLDPH